jgi:hypothetical protein
VKFAIAFIETSRASQTASVVICGEIVMIAMTVVHRDGRGQGHRRAGPGLLEEQATTNA